MIAATVWFIIKAFLIYLASGLVLHFPIIVRDLYHGRVGGWTVFATSTAERRLWWDSDKHHDGGGKPGFGGFLDVWWGPQVRPVKKYYKLLLGQRPGNPWKGDHWFVMRIPWFCFPFFSLAVSRLGFYAGTKAHVVDERDVKHWAEPSDLGKEYLVLSVTTRKTRIR